MTVRCESGDKKAWASAAAKDARDLNSWVRKTLNAAAKKAAR